MILTDSNFFLLGLFSSFLNFQIVASLGAVSIITVIIGQNPMYGIYSTGPVYDIAFEIIKQEYPEVAANTSFHQIYKQRPAASSGCLYTGDMMPEVAGEIMEIIIKSTAQFALLMSPGEDRKVDREISLPQAVTAPKILQSDTSFNLPSKEETIGMINEEMYFPHKKLKV